VRPIRRDLQTDSVIDAPRVLTEHEDRWIMPFRGLVVTQVQVDGAFGLNLNDVGAVRISNTAMLGWVRVAAKPDESRFEPERQDVAAGLALFNTKVLSAVAFKSGHLRIVFNDGHLLRVSPDERYEAWTATGPDRMLIVSLPGGGLAVSPSRT
jgi:hypothetical protein